MLGDPSRPDVPTFADMLRRESLSLNVVRLVLALLVLVSHAWPLGGLGDDPRWPPFAGTTLGEFAVGGFFALSGALVTMSGQRRSAGDYVRSRVLRILPAYITVLLATAFVLGPLIFFATHGALEGYFTLARGGPVTYVLHNVSFPVGLQYGILDVFADTTPYGKTGVGSVINGSLWTLPLEARCYVVALLVVLLGRRLGLTRVALAVLSMCGLLLFWRSQDPGAAEWALPDFIPSTMLELLFVFMCGALAGSLAHILRVSGTLIVGVLVLHLAAWLLGGVWYRAVGLGTLCLLLPMLASLLPRRGIGWLRNDLSYGVYIWAFPVQQTLAFLGLYSRPMVFIGGAAVITLALALVSWKLVEAPALRMKYRTIARVA